MLGDENRISGLKALAGNVPRKIQIDTAVIEHHGDLLTPAHHQFRAAERRATANHLKADAELVTMQVFDLGEMWLRASTATLRPLASSFGIASPWIDCNDHNQLAALVMVGVLQRHTMLHEDLHFGSCADEFVKELGLFQHER